MSEVKFYIETKHRENWIRDSIAAKDFDTAVQKADRLREDFKLNQDAIRLIRAEETIISFIGKGEEAK